MIARAAIDVSDLPHSAMDHRSPIWWGNLLLLFIETTMFAILVAAYFYLRMNFELWPPVRSDGPVGLFKTDPLLALATWNLPLIVLSCAPMVVADLACLRMDQAMVKIGLLLCVLMGLAAIVLRFLEFPRLLFVWDANAYAATIWTILGLHLLHLITGTLENLLMLAWIMLKGLDNKHARDVRVTATYWYWIVGIWLLLYGIVYLAPRFL